MDSERTLNREGEAPMQTQIASEIAELQKLKASALKARYRELFAQDSRSSNRAWLVRRIAWRLQAIAFGDLSERARARATELARDADLRLRPTPEVCRTIIATTGAQRSSVCDARI